MSTSVSSRSEPWVVYGTDCSYYTGKLEAYFRAKGIAYRLEPFNEENMRRCARYTGVIQIPQVERPDRSWLVDTTRIIDHLEREQPEPAMQPSSAALGFISLLLEDFADEWLWRPAMHYRWSFARNAKLMSDWLAEHAAERRGPQWMKRLYWTQRQYRTFVAGDGVTPATRAAVEASYLDTLDALEPIVARRPYLLGERPTRADFGFFGPMFRHFSCDPVPGRIMRTRAPAVNEWVARLWNASPRRFAGTAMPETIPGDLGALLCSIREIYLPYLRANAEAFARGDRRVSYPVQGVTFEEPTKPYRVWCRDRLHRAFTALPADDRAAVEAALGSTAAAAELAQPSPSPVDEIIGPLPIVAGPGGKPADSWWRR